MFYWLTENDVRFADDQEGKAIQELLLPTSLRRMTFNLERQKKRQNQEWRKRAYFLRIIQLISKAQKNLQMSPNQFLRASLPWAIKNRSIRRTEMGKCYSNFQGRKRVINQLQINIFNGQLNLLLDIFNVIWNGLKFSRSNMEAIISPLKICSTSWILWLHQRCLIQPAIHKKH